MAVHHPGRAMGLEEMKRLIYQIATQAVENASFGSAGLRVYDGGWITIQNGGLSVTGSAIVSGLLDVTGNLNGSGIFDWTGTTRLRGPIMVTGNMTGSGQMVWSGPWELRGAGSITGNVGVTGQLNVTGTSRFGNLVYVDNGLIVRDGYIQAGPVRIDRGGPYGGRIASTGPALVLDASGSVIIEAPYTVVSDLSARNVSIIQDLSVQGSVNSKVKNFKIPHPTREDHWLKHGCTESPVSGVEYTGSVELNEHGEAVVELPEYFEALTKPEGRTIHLTPIGRPFMVGADRVKDGKFTVYGDPGREVSWLVKAERAGAEFDLEEPVFGPLRQGSDRSAPQDTRTPEPR